MSAAPSSYEGYRREIVELYERHDPGKLRRVDEILRRFEGREEALVRTLKRKFLDVGISGGKRIPAGSDAEASQPSTTREDFDPSQLSPTGSQYVAAGRADEKIVPSVMAAASAAAFTHLKETIENPYADSSGYPTQTPSQCEVYDPLRECSVYHRPAQNNRSEEIPDQAAASRDGMDPVVQYSTSPLQSRSPISSLLHFSLSQMGDGSDPQSSQPLSSDASSSLSAEDYRARAISLYRQHEPVELHRVDGQLNRYKGQEEAYLRALERKFKKNRLSATGKDHTGEATLPATAIAEGVGPLTDTHGRTSDSVDCEENQRHLPRVQKARMSDQRGSQETQRQHYLNVEEDVMQEGGVECSLGPAAPVANTHTTIPTATAEVKMPAVISTTHIADTLSTVASSAPMTVVAGQHKSENCTAYVSPAIEATSPAVCEMTAAALSVRGKDSACAREVGSVSYRQWAETSDSPSASVEKKETAEVERVPTHRGNRIAAGTPVSRDPPLNAACSPCAPCTNSGGARTAASLWPKSIAVPDATHDTPDLVPTAGLLLAPSDRRAGGRVRELRTAGAVDPVPECQLGCSLPVSKDQVDALFRRTIKRMVLFDIIFHDFFCVLGSFYYHGCERISLEVGRALLRVLFPEISLEEVGAQHVDISCSSEAGKEAGLPPDEMRECIIQEAVRQLQSNPNVSKVFLGKYAQFLVGRMENFVKTCRLRLVQLQRQPRLLSAGFWVHRCIMPRAVPYWTRCWATTSAGEDALLMCYTGSLKTELRIPFAHVARCYRDKNVTGAPPAHARNGLAFQMTSGATPLLVVLCPEVADVATQLLSAFRSWCGSVRERGGGSTAKRRESSLLSAPCLESVASREEKQVQTNQVRVWVFSRTAMSYEPQNWCVDGPSIHMLGDHTRELDTCAIANIKNVISEMELPVTPPVRDACGFMLCFSNSLVPLMAFTEGLHERTKLMDRIHRSQVLLQVTLRTK